MALALWDLHPASNCAGTFFLVAVCQNYRVAFCGLPLPHLVHARPERIRLMSCTILARRGTHGHTRHIEKRAQQDSRTVERLGYRNPSTQREYHSTTRTSKDERRRTRQNFSLTESTLGTSAGPQGCLDCSKASHFSGRSGADQSGSKGEMG